MQKFLTPHPQEQRWWLGIQQLPVLSPITALLSVVLMLACTLPLLLCSMEHEDEEWPPVPISHGRIHHGKGRAQARSETR